MKKNYLKITFSALLLASTAHAIAETQDQSSILAVTGKVSNASAACQVTLSNNVITLNSTSGSLIEQGQNATDPALITFSVKGSADFTQCSEEVYNGKVAVKFTGSFDNADGNVFSNTDTSGNAASGVGIGLFKGDKTPIDVRETYTIADKTNDSTNIIGIQLVKLKGQTVTSGSVTGNITFQIERL
ncbi:fimbrial protein [Cronobacter sakazakii]|uniref:fimbrial protein n=1 Tax=Cronobacter sakazakii TaxID=28141 RepID=UPI000CFB440B|nr:fimbrial protein [Cronobacter sakazakii]